MKLIIDIPDEDYDVIKSGSQMVYSGMRSGKTYLIKMFEIILNGIPLDKIKAEITVIPQINSDGHNNNWYREPQAIIDDVIDIIDNI